MKIKHNGKVILITLVVLIVFSSLVIWHDKPPQDASGKQDLIQKIAQKNSDFMKFIAQHDGHEDRGFYSVGIPDAQQWPRDIMRACYSDPLAAKGQFSGISKTVSNELELIRYRSVIDLLMLLQQAESSNPGYLAELDFKSHVMIQEDSLSLSYRSMMAILFGLLGLFVVGMIRPRN